jgi:hypothetical protein
MRETRSPWSSGGVGNTTAYRNVGVSPLSSPRADAGAHIARHIGNGMINPRLLRHDQGVTPSTLNRPLSPTSKY